MSENNENSKPVAAGSECSAGLGAEIKDVIEWMVTSAHAELIALTEAELANEWFWKWEKGRSAEWNTYQFSGDLESYKRRCRQWEEHHNGSCCVVERVREKYLMPRVKAFLAELKAQSA